MATETIVKEYFHGYYGHCMLTEENGRYLLHANNTVRSFDSINEADRVLEDEGFNEC